jgi:hypothetical protein
MSMKHILLGIGLVGIGMIAEAQGTLSSQVLRLLGRVNTWTAAQTFSVDIQISTINTAAPAGADCDAAGETGKYYWDSTNDNLYICSGVSGWRKVTTAAP